MMVGPERPRPAQELTNPSSTVEESCLRHLIENEGRLCTVKELEALFSPALIESSMSVGEIVRRVRATYLGDRGSVITLLSPARETHGFYFLSDGRVARGLRELGVSLLKDDPDGVAIPGLTILSSKIKKNRLIKPHIVISLLDQLSPKDSQSRQRPYLSRTQRRLLAFLAEHPEGVSTEALLKQGVGLDHVDLERDRAVISNNLAYLRQKIRGSGVKIYRLSFLGKPRENGYKRVRYFLIGEEQVGREVQIPLEDREVFDALIEPAQKIVEGLCSRFIPGERLTRSLCTPQRKLLYFLASRFGVPCSMIELAVAVYPSARLPQDSLDALIVNKRGVQKALEGSEFTIVSIPRCYEIPGLFSTVGAYLLGDRVALQRERVVIPLLFPGEFLNLYPKIRHRIREMCQLTVAVRDGNGELIRRQTVVSLEERKLLLALARNFPRGCPLPELTSSLIPGGEDGHARKAIINRVISLRKKIETYFVSLRISIEYDRKGDQYRLEVKK